MWSGKEPELVRTWTAGCSLQRREESIVMEQVQLYMAHGSLKAFDRSLDPQMVDCRL
jgi:hypothetical protein